MRCCPMRRCCSPSLVATSATTWSNRAARSTRPLFEPSAGCGCASSTRAWRRCRWSPARWSPAWIGQLTLQGRDQINDVEVAFSNDGILEGLKVRCLHNLGGVLMHPIAAPPLRVTDYATGAYRTPAFSAEVFGVYTNTAPTGPYRGAGRPEAAMIAERAIDAVARELGLDPITI